MPDYKNSKIYTIRCTNDPTLIYVGSTTQSLSQRFNDHRRRMKQDKYKHIKLYQTFNELGVNNFYIELFENVICHDKEQLLAREGAVIREMGNLNERISGRNNTEWVQDNKEYMKECWKKYYLENKEAVINYQREYNEKNKERLQEKRKTTIICLCGLEINKAHKTRHEKSKKHLDLMDIKNSQQDTK